jgi:hypothetical protein
MEIQIKKIKSRNLARERVSRDDWEAGAGEGQLKKDM